jgi:raffinose synthase
MWNRCGAAGLVAAFNVNREGQSVSGTVGPRDVPGLIGERFVVYEHFGRQAQMLTTDGEIDVSLEEGGCALYVLVPAAGRHTPLGLVNKYISPATISSQFSAEDKTTTVLKEGGVSAWVSDRPPIRVQVNGKAVVPETGAGIYTLDCSELKEAVWIEIE